MILWLRPRKVEAPSSPKVVLIAGGSTGLGLAMAREFARLGHKVVVSSHNADNLVFAWSRALDDGLSIELDECDCRDRAQVEALVQRTVERHGGIDVLVNNAGIIQVGPVESMALSDFEDAMATMYWGPVYATLAALPVMKSRCSGRIVNITSIGGVVSVPHLLPYSAAKAAAVGFSKGLASELAGSGVSVLTVVPGLMRTGSFLNARFSGQEEKEFRWFAVASSTPGISISADAAARRIVKAALGRESHLTLSLPANVIARLQGVAPGITAKLLGVQSRLLPDAGAKLPGFNTQGYKLGASEEPVLKKLTVFGQRAASKLQPSRRTPVRALPDGSESARSHLAEVVGEDQQARGGQSRQQ